MGISTITPLPKLTSIITHLRAGHTLAKTAELAGVSRNTVVRFKRRVRDHLHTDMPAKALAERYCAERAAMCSRPSKKRAYAVVGHRGMTILQSLRGVEQSSDRLGRILELPRWRAQQLLQNMCKRGLISVRVERNFLGQEKEMFGLTESGWCALKRNVVIARKRVA